MEVSRGNEKPRFEAPLLHNNSLKCQESEGKQGGTALSWTHREEGALQPTCNAGAAVLSFPSELSYTQEAGSRP